MNGFVKSLNQFNEKLDPFPLDINFTFQALDLCTKDSLLIATTLEKGIFMIHNNKVVKNINTSNGLSSNACYKSVLYKNKLFTASSKGINIYDFATDSIFHVFESDGLASNTVNDLAIENDTIYAATENGLSIIPISAIKRVRDFPLFIKPIYKTNDTIWDIPKLLVSHSDTNLSIVLNTLSFGVKGTVNYFYRVKELDSNFKTSVAQDVALSFAEPGNFTFEAYAIDGNGTLSKTIVLPIYIKPYFYQTLWFKLLMGLLGIGIISFGFIYFLERAKRKEQAKNELENKIRNLEISAWKSAINPHFLFNSLNTMQGLFRLNEFEKANSYVAEFASVLRKTIDQSGRLLIKLDNEIPYLKNYLELERIKRAECFDYSIDLPNNEITNYFIPSLLIQPVIENCLKHAIQDKALGKIKINFTLHKDHILCTVQDNGKGYPEVAMSKDYVSKGINLIKNKISIVERLTLKKIGFTYQNLLDSDGSILGSETVFSFPFIIFDYNDSSDNY